MIVVLDIGCLECGNETNLLGTYPDEAQAREAHPEVKMRDTLTNVWGGWHGDSMTVGFEVVVK